MSDKLNKDGLDQVWKKVWNLVKTVTGSVDYKNSGTLQDQINSIKTGYAAKNHTHTAADVGAAASTHSHSNYAASNHTHTAAQVGAAASNHTHTAADVGAAPASRSHSGYASRDLYDTYTINIGRKGGTTTGQHSVAEGNGTTASNWNDHTEGNNTTASGGNSHAEGETTTASGAGSHAEGTNTTASGASSHAEGWGTIANNGNSHACGRFNKQMSQTDIFVIGNGADSSTRSNAFRVTSDGASYGLKAFNSSGADYAEFIKPWHDGNPGAEDRVGYFVTVKDGLLYKAEPGSYICGITSGNPSVVGNADEDYYRRYERDEFNRIVMEDVEEEIQETDEETGETVTVKTGNMIKRMKLAEGYDPSLQNTYVERRFRKEWDYVGMVGVIPVRDDGTCVPGQFCRCGAGGTATLAEERGFDTYMVLERIADNVVAAILKP